MSDRQKLFLALLVSALFHLGVGLLLGLWREQSASTAPLPKPDLANLTVTIMPPRAAPAQKAAPALSMMPTPPPAHFIPPALDSDGLTPSKKAPARAMFQSDANMVAGSLLPATGNIPLPSEAGPREKFMDFANRPATLGNGRAPSAPSRSRPAAASSLAPQSPSAVTHVQRSGSPTPSPSSPPEIAKTTPQPTPPPTPTPRPAPSAPPDALALGTPTLVPATPTPAPVAELARLNTSPPLRGSAEMQQMTRPSTPASQPAPDSAEPATQRRMDRTHIDGGIEEHGAPGVDAVETPFGRYHRKLSNLIGSRWQLYLQEHPKDVGDVTILVKLNTSGRVAGTRVVANHSMDDLAELSTRAIMESDLPPIPDDLAPMLRDGKLEITFNFNVYDPSNDSSGR